MFVFLSIKGCSQTKKYLIEKAANLLMQPQRRGEKQLMNNITFFKKTHLIGKAAIGDKIFF